MKSLVGQVADFSMTIDQINWAYTTLSSIVHLRNDKLQKETIDNS